MRTNLSLNEKHLQFILGILLQLLCAHLILKIPNAKDPLADRLDSNYLLFLVSTFLFLRLCIHTMWYMSTLRKESRFADILERYKYVSHGLPFVLFILLLVLMLKLVAVAAGESLGRTGYLYSVIPLFVVLLILLQIGYAKMPGMYHLNMMDWRNKPMVWEMLDLNYKNAVLKISLEEVAILIFLNRRCLVITVDGRLMYHNKLTQPKFWLLKGAEKFKAFSGNGVVREKWVEGVSYGAEKLLRLKPFIQKHIDALIEHADNYPDEAYDQDVLRRYRLKVSERYFCDLAVIICTLEYLGQNILKFEGVSGNILSLV